MTGLGLDFWCEPFLVFDFLVVAITIALHYIFHGYAIDDVIGVTGSWWGALMLQRVPISACEGADTEPLVREITSGNRAQ